LRMRDYPEGFKDQIAAAAGEAGVHLKRGLRLTYATDGLVPLRASYPTASICSVNEYMLPSNYHSPNDTPDRVDYDCVADGVRLIEAATRRLARANA
jgi:putative aminopeptidase FrvX